MGFVGSLLGIIGFGIGVPLGLLLGYFIFIYFQPRNVNEVPVTELPVEMYFNSWFDFLALLPLWVMKPDYERVDWLNMFIRYMWPYLDKAICGSIQRAMKPYFAEYMAKFHLKSIDFESLTLGTLPPTIQGLKVYESNQDELISELALTWAGNPNIEVAVKMLAAKVTVQLIDTQISATARITLKPFVPTFPCFSTIAVSLMKKPEVDFGLKIMGGNLMSIPGIYPSIQELISKEVAKLYLWPKTLEIPMFDGSIGEVKKPVGILRVKVLRALKLLNKDFLGASDPYVVLSLTGEKIPAKKTSVTRDNLNPEWNEEFKIPVKDPHSQILELHVYDWEKLGCHDKLGMQVVPLRLLTAYEKKEFTLDLLNSTDPNDPHNKKPRGQIMLEITFVPFLEDSKKFTEVIEYGGSRSLRMEVPKEDNLSGAGLLLVTIISAKDVEGRKHTNPYAVITLNGEKRKTKSIRKNRDPTWNEEFEFLLEEAPLKEQINVEISSKPRGIGFISSKEPLGHVDINLGDVVYNGRINEKYHLINSKNGIVHIELQWKAI
ncbi:OLC1v1034557C1 [Oldenlandia corymbosa var. corymbosa]|uniref:OLC1v1034557C1 n=1 Tax=Oldenlandia corymbosa var. corymbosa TaxID=529605 RepID=A0AAV1CSK2_OLDCO|nr:OLC1v1034557C1 [Oldenlandia corymbosa var. corymbosa]